jgi:quinoprotein glucose dehydrogenase
LKADTGQEIWRTKFEGMLSQRGVNVWKSKDGKESRIIVLDGGTLRTLDAKTGAVITTFGNAGGVDLRDALSREDRAKVRPLHTDNPGRVFEDTIIMSLPAGAYTYDSAPADIQAYDVRTGKLKWVFHVVPEKGEYGYDTWPAKDHERFGGAHNWSESTIDHELGILYVPTGAPRFDWYGANRPGNNLFANSIIAIDARTGKRVWHFQTTHHDLWDFDNPTAPKLLTIQKDGKDVPIVILPTKMGYLFVFDRRTGEPIWPIEERPVPKSDRPGEWVSPTQPFPVWPLPYGRYRFTEEDINPYIPEADKAKIREMMRTQYSQGMYTPVSERGTFMMPNQNGGSNWGMVSVDPVNNRLYIVVRHYPSYEKLVPSQKAGTEVMPNGSAPGVRNYDAPFDYLIQSNGMVPISPPWSTIVAYDMNNGQKLYEIPNGDMAVLGEKGVGLGSQTTRGGPTTTASGLMFVATASDRKFRARDVRNGQILWEYDLPASSEGIPATYEVNGRQYVLIPSGGAGMFHWTLGLPPTPKTNRYIAFALPEKKAK